MEISLAPEILFHIGSIAITNALFTGVIVFLLILLFSVFMKSKLSYANPGKFQLLFEIMFETLYEMVSDVMEKAYARKFFSFIFTFFVFILFSNWFGLLPIVPSISVERHEEENYIETEHAIDLEIIPSASAETLEHEEEEDSSFWSCLKSKHCYLSTDGIKQFHSSTHVLRAPSSDLSFAIALALISVIATNYLGFKYMKKGYLKKYLNFKGPIEAFVGFLEIISEFGKLISFSFRLFGNVFAGEVLLVVITAISLGLATLPFLMLEIFVGVIQAFVFFILTAVFIGLALSHHH